MPRSEASRHRPLPTVRKPSTHQHLGQRPHRPYLLLVSLVQDLERAHDVVMRRALGDPHQLIEIHRQLKEGTGRRTLELSLNRSVIVLSVAAWQAYIEEVARALLASLGTPIALTQEGRTLSALWQARNEELDRSIHNYNSPNTENTVRLLASLGFNPKPHWTWGVGGGSVTPGQAGQRLNHWVKVRHAIAHGSALPDVPVLSKTKSGRTVQLRDAETCLEFLQRLARHTQDAAVDFGHKIEGVESSLQMREAQLRSSQAAVSSALRRFG